MGAPKRKPPQTTVWLQPRTSPRVPASFQAKVLAYAGARGALRKLSDAGFGADLLWRHLWGLASLKKAPGNRRFRWYALPGLPPHTLRRFPDRVRRMSDEIERMDEKMRSDRAAYGATVHFLPLFLAGAIPGAKTELSIDGNVLRDVGTGTRSLPAARARNLLHRLDELPKLAALPKLLRFYADYIEVVSKLAAHHASKAPALLNAMMPIELMEAVKKQTGKPHTADIAALLQAAYFALSGIEETVDPRNLKMQYRRRNSPKK
jgi:hypothetical protein